MPRPIFVNPLPVHQWVLLLSLFLAAGDSLAAKPWLLHSRSIWTPDASTVAEVQALLPALTEKIKVFATTEPSGAKRPPGIPAPNKYLNYYFVYEGVISAAGRRLVHVEGSCQPIDATLDTHTADGGDCFISFEYDPATKRSSPMWVNGLG